MPTDPTAIAEIGRALEFYEREWLRSTDGERYEPTDALWEDKGDKAAAALRALRSSPAREGEWVAPLQPDAFRLGDRVRKIKGSSWQGRIVGFYSTKLTPDGYAVESEREPGSVQIYPQAALELVPSSPSKDRP
jgi:hypothetical protein